MAFAAIAMSASLVVGQTQQAMFDTDSAAVGIDNHCTACIFNDINDFVGPLSKTDRKIKGFGGSRTTNMQLGTIVWKIPDDQGRMFTHRIPKSYYVPHGGVKLLNPQHFAKV